MNLKQIRYALAVAEEQSFTRAAQRCHTVQSALSHQIARLEDELGCSLFERTSRRVRLTTAGQAFIPSAQRLLAAKQTLMEVPLVDFYSGTAARRQTDRAFQAAGIKRHVSFEIDHFEWLENLVSRGLAAAHC